MTQQINPTISNLIQSQFPDLYQTDGPAFIAFIEAYYEWMEQEGNPIYHIRNLFQYSDIDRTMEQFVVYFTNTYLQGIQFNTLSDKRLTVKKILDLYRAKGSIRAIKLLFQLVFGEDIDIYVPGEDILKPSDGVWNIPTYLEISYSTDSQNYVGKKITGKLSGAYAYVEQLVRRRVGNSFVDVLFITNLSKNIDFQTGELVSIDGSNLQNAPTVIGSLSELEIQDGSFGFVVGDLVNLNSNYGVEGVGRVANTQQITGIVNFTLEDGGWGYTSAYSNVLLSQTVLKLENIIDRFPVSNSYIPIFSNIYFYNAFSGLQTATFQGNTISGNSFLYINVSSTATVANVANVYIGQIVSGSNIAPNTFVTSVNSTVIGMSAGSLGSQTGITFTTNNPTVANLSANAIAVSSNMTLYCAPISGTFLKNETIIGNAYSCTIPSATGTISGLPQTNTYTTLLLSNNVGSFLYPEVVYQSNGTSNLALGTILRANSSTIILSANTAAFKNTYGIRGGNSGATANITVSSLPLTTLLVSNVNDSFFGDTLGLVNTTIVGLKSNAYANVLFFNSTAGIIGLSNTLTTQYNTIRIVLPENLGYSSLTGTLYPGESVYQKYGSNVSGLGIVAGVNSTFISIMPTLGGIMFATSGSYSNLYADVSNVTFTLVGSNTFLQGETIYQTNGTANTATGLLIQAQTTNLVFNTTSGSFSNTLNILGGLSNANALPTSAITVNVGAVTTAITSAAYVSPQSTAWINSFSSGSLANVQIGTLNVTEDYLFNSDMVGGVNAANVLYQLLPLNALAFGFPKNYLANVTNSYLVDVLNFQLLQLGEIESIQTINPGINYNASPFTEIYQNGIYSLQKQDYIATVSNTVGNFIVGEPVYQNVLNANIQGFQTQYNSTFVNGETIYQIKSKPTKTYTIVAGNTTVVTSDLSTYDATIIVGSTIITGNSTAEYDVRVVNSSINSSAFTLKTIPATSITTANIFVVNAYGIFNYSPTTNVVYYSNNGPNGFVTGANVYGATSNSNLLINSLTTTPYVTAQGRVRSISNDKKTIYIRRLSVNGDFANNNQPLVGGVSAATANIVSVIADANSDFAGYNANIMSTVTTGNGSVSVLAVEDSGFGYVNGELMQFTSLDGTRSGSVYSVLGKQGVGQGYYSSTRGFTSDDKYIQDGEYYQTFSYEIQSSLDISSYYQMVKQTVHTAGMNMFGKVVKKETVATPLSIVNLGYGPIQHS